MANILIKLKVDGIEANGKNFSAIYGEYTVDSNHNYTIGSRYIILSTNIASICFGNLPESARVKNLLDLS